MKATVQNQRFLKLIDSNQLNLKADCINYAGIGISDLNGDNQIFLGIVAPNALYVYKKLNGGSYSAIHTHTLSGRDSIWTRIEYELNNTVLTVKVYDTSDNLLYSTDLTVDSVFNGNTMYPCLVSYWNTSTVSSVKNIVIK